MSEVGLSHSSEETHESVWSKGGNKSTFVGRETCGDTGGLEYMEKERKTIKYQSEKHEKLTSLMNRVNAESLKLAHKKQKTGKAVGIDGETKVSYGEDIEGNLTNLVERMKRLQYIPSHSA